MGPCRLIVPSIDRLLTERLQSQTTIATSLMQSLYVDIKAHVRTELDAAEEQLNKLGAEADMLGEKLSDLMEENFWERIIIFLVCGGTLIICILAIWTIRKSQLLQKEYCSGITSKIEEIAEQYSQMGRKIPFRRDPFSSVPFSFAGEGPPPNLHRELVRKSVGRLE